MRRVLVWLVMRLCWSWQRVVLVNASVPEALEARQQPCIFVAWHCTLFSVIPFLGRFSRQNLHGLVSRSRDGQDFRWVMRRMGLGGVQGSTSAGGLQGLYGALRHLRRGGALLVTPDGPRGPRYHLNADGIIFLALQSGAPLVPVHASSARRWRIGSWDRLCLARPFARTYLVFGDPLWLASASRREERPARLKAGHARVEAQLRLLALRTEQLSGAEPDPALTALVNTRP